MRFGETKLAIATRLIRPPGLVGQGGDSYIAVVVLLRLEPVTPPRVLKRAASR
jgi:hypothetical protein